MEWRVYTGIKAKSHRKHQDIGKENCRCNKASKGFCLLFCYWWVFIFNVLYVWDFWKPFRTYKMHTVLHSAVGIFFCLIHPLLKEKVPLVTNNLYNYALLGRSILVVKDIFSAKSDKKIREECMFYM